MGRSSILENISFQTCRSSVRSSCSHNVIRDSEVLSEGVELQSGVASDGAVMAVPLSLVVTADGKEVSVVNLRAFLVLTDTQWSSCTPVLSTKTSLLTCQASAVFWGVTFLLCSHEAGTWSWILPLPVSLSLGHWDPLGIKVGGETVLVLWYPFLLLFFSDHPTFSLTVAFLQASSC